jgi:general secretion pathway protein B
VSFILDALKKAESERNRASGPVLVDVRLAPPRRGLPAWAWVLGGVLLVNLAILGWLMLRKSPTHPAPAANSPVAAPALLPTAPAEAVPTSPPVLPPVAAISPSAASVPPTTAASPAATPDFDDLPTAQQLLAQGVSLPPLLLNLHVYDATPSLRFVMLNGLRLGEGEFTPDGIKVVAITEHGVVLDARNRRFVLPAGG